MLIVNSDHLLILVGILAAVVCVVLITDTFKHHRRSVTPELDGIVDHLEKLAECASDAYTQAEQSYEQLIDTQNAIRVILHRIDDRERQRDDRAATKAALAWDKS